MQLHLRHSQNELISARPWKGIPSTYLYRIIYWILLYNSNPETNLHIDMYVVKSLLQAPVQVFLPHVDIDEERDEVVIKSSIDGGPWIEDTPTSPAKPIQGLDAKQVMNKIHV